MTLMTARITPLDGDHLNPAALDRAHQLASKAVQLDPSLPQAYATYRYEQEAEAAFDALRRTGLPEG